MPFFIFVRNRGFFDKLFALVAVSRGVECLGAFLFIFAGSHAKGAFKKAEEIHLVFIAQRVSDLLGAHFVFGKQRSRNVHLFMVYVLDGRDAEGF